MDDPDLSNCRVLIVEDSDSIVLELQKVLESFGIDIKNITIAVDGLEGLERIEEDVFDIIVSDVMMPNCDGIEMLKRIRAKHPFFDTPFIYLTSEKDLELVLDAIDLGVKNYLIKPVTTKKVSTKIIPILNDSIKLSSQSLNIVLEEYGYLKHIFHMVENSILILTPEHKIERSNMAFQHKVGLNHRKLRGQDFLETYVSSECNQKLEEDGEFENVKLKLKAGKTSEAKVLKFTLKDKKNNPTHHIVIIQEKKVA